MSHWNACQMSIAMLRIAQCPGGVSRESTVLVWVGTTSCTYTGGIWDDFGAPRSTDQLSKWVYLSDDHGMLVIWIGTHSGVKADTADVAAAVTASHRRTPMTRSGRGSKRKETTGPRAWNRRKRTTGPIYGRGGTKEIPGWMHGRLHDLPNRGSGQERSQPSKYLPTILNFLPPPP